MAQGIKPGLPKKKCELCGTEFRQKTSWQKFCSRRCEQKHLSIINPVSKRKAYRKWLKNKLLEHPNFYKEIYYKRKTDNYEKFREQRNRWAKTQYHKFRSLALEHYGKQCDCCNEIEKEFLGIDHINGGGTKHRKELKNKSNIYRWVCKNNYPKEFRILCHNCNLSLGFYGYCPHKKLRRDSEGN